MAANWRRMACAVRMSPRSHTLGSGIQGGRVPVPIPLRLWKVWSGNAHPTIPVTGDLAGGGQARERLTKALIADANGRANRVARESLATGVLQRVENGGVQIDGPGRRRWGRRFWGRDQAQVQVWLAAQQRQGQ